jgi:SWI/SNF-related matrix-associated actin-dependent regulator 1 of chromatin subfamily A
MYDTKVINKFIYVKPKGVDAKHTKELKEKLEQAGGVYQGQTQDYQFPFDWETIEKLHKFAAVNKYVYMDKSYPEITLNRDRVPHIRDYQVAPLEYILSRRGRILLADDVGLGKTITSASYFLYTKINYPLLIVCTASTKLQWEREFKRFDLSNKKVVVCEGLASVHKHDADVVIINYDLFSSHVCKEKNRYMVSDALDDLKSMKFQGVILDECQRMKSPDTLWNNGIRFVIDEVPNVLALSATPIENKPIEFFNILNILRPDIWHNYRHFAERYCNGHMAKRYIRYGKTRKTQEYFDVSGSSNLPELYELLKKHVMFRRVNQGTIAGLPKVSPPIVLPLRMSPAQLKEYEAILNDEAETTTRKGGTTTAGNTLTRTNRLKEFAAVAKLEYVKTFLKDFIANGDDKIVVFTEHHITIDTLYEEFKKYSVKFDGRTSSKKKDDAKEKFIKDKDVRIFFGQVASAGEGLDGLQTVCNKLMYVELPYKPTTIRQCNGRVERVGSPFEYVVVYFPILLDTVEERIIDILVDKQTNILTVLDGDMNDESITRQVREVLKEKGLDISL